MKLKNNTDKHDVLKTFQSWIQAYENKSVKELGEVISPSEEHLNWGTGADERYVGHSQFLRQIQRDFEQSEGLKLNVLNFYSVLHENSAWIAAEVEPIVKIKGESHTFETLRATMILAKESGEWKVEHIHTSWPYPKQLEGNSFPELSTS